MNTLKQVIIALVLPISMIGCGSSADSAAGYVESGKLLLEQGKIEKARLEFKNAIQVDPKVAEPYYQLALLDEKDQRWKGMFNNLMLVEQLDPNYHKATIKLGQVNLLAGNFELASQKANKVLDADKSHILAWVLRASISMKQKDFEAALSDADQALSIDSKNIEALSVKALTQNLQGDSERALATLDKAIALKPKQLPLQMMKLSILDSQKDYVAMEQLYRELQVLNADTSWIPISLAKLLNSQDRYTDAKKVLEKYVSTHSDDQKIKLFLVSLVKIKEPEQAISLLSDFIQQNPGDFDLRFGKAELLVEVGQLDKAIDEIKEISKLDSEGNFGRKANVMLAVQAFRKGDMEAANSQVMEVLTAAPEDEAGLLLKARINLVDKEFDAAVTNLRVVLRNNPESDQALVLLAQSYMNSGATDLAEDNFRQALVVNPGNTVAALSVANGLMQSNDLNRAEGVLVNALKKIPNNAAMLQALAHVKLLKKDWLGTQSIVDTLFNDDKNSAVATYLSARILQGQKQYVEAIDEYKRVLEQNPNITRALQGIAFSYTKLEQKGELLSFLKGFNVTHPRQFEGYAIQSNLYILDKAYEKAIEVLEKGLEVEPNWLTGYSALASIYLSQGDVDKASLVYFEGLAVAPKNNSLSMQLASLYEQKGKFSEAKGLYEDVLERNKDIEPAINNLASLLTDQFRSAENLKKAEAITRRFKSATEPYYLDTYAWVLVQQGDLDKSLPVLERVVTLAPEVAVFSYHLGAAYAKQKNIEQATKYLEIAMKLADKQGDEEISKKATELLANRI